MVKYPKAICRLFILFKFGKIRLDIIIVEY